ncbi:LysM peptidoglycan-binding domain-containing protein [Paenibacillus sp. JMULE4]|uniref:Peptidoglycan DD-metalloendopeptidase family protein n=1 Tax=Paenibacillus validus TaxID=44253 RepID=A0A7X2ZDP8_9BACL|nr:MULTISPECIES: peptidoglycan DD-metalloendopeptidase family protein [Paenibacillus]MUG73035.1 peptidoglycan DD-metalloendopeptidase family protein [Paenibacillus validus]NTZ19496.1 LysM peptidoglycan-binding domain-containing protein [Paenibacillus sp. JMULE4]
MKLSVDLFNYHRRKWIFTLIALILGAVGIVAYVNASAIDRYRVYLDQTYIGSVSNQEIVQEWIKKKEQALSAQFPHASMKLQGGQVRFELERTIRKDYDNNLVITELEKRLTPAAVGVEIRIGGKAIGVVKDYDTAQALLEGIKRKYHPDTLNANEVRSLSAADNDDKTGKPVLESLQFVQEVSLQKTVTSPDKISAVDQIRSTLETGGVEPVKYTVQEGDCVSCIAKKFNIPLALLYKNNPWIQDDFINIGDVLDLTVSKPILSVQSLEKRTDTLTIPRGTQVQNDPSMRVGVSQVVQEGKDGIKQITYRLTKINGELVEEVPENEVVLEEPVDKIVRQGTKVIPGNGTGKFVWPIVSPKLTSEFGKRWGKLHAGADAVSSNRSILASDRGKVAFAGEKSGYGNCIIIDHQNGYQTLYAHLSKIEVKSGQTVEKGEKIGVMGSTGNSTGIHLHFEIRKNGTQQNPLKYLNR